MIYVNLVLEIKIFEGVFKKFMKGKKIILPVLLTSVVSSPMVANLVTSVSAPVFADTITNVEADYITVTNMFSKEGYKRGDVVPADEMPKVKVAEGVDYEVVVYAPTGKKVASWTNPTPTTENYTLELQYKGTYTFKFRTANAAKAVSLCDDIYLYVAEDAYALTLAGNDYWALPGVVATGSQVKLGVPSLTINGESKPLPDFSGTVAGGDANGLLVTVIGPTTTTYLTQAQDGGEHPDYYVFEASDAGRYTVKYDYYAAGKKVANLASKTLRAVNNYSVADQYKLEFSLNSSIDSVSKVLGNTVTLPSVKAVNSKASTTTAVDAYTKIIVTYIGGSSNPEDQAVVGTPEAVQVVEDFRYTYKWAGNYKVEYEVSIPNLGVTATVLTKYINGVTDSVKPKINLTYGYTWNNQVASFTKGNEALGLLDVTGLDQDAIINALADFDATHMLNSVYELPDTENPIVTVTIPAAFATDNYDNPSAINIEREVYVSGKSSEKLIRTTENDANTAVDLKFGLNADQSQNIFKFGKFVVKYYAYDNAHQGNPTITEYTFEVKENGSVEMGAPTVYMQYFDKTRVKEGETITVTKPTATDYKSQDSALEMHTYYYIGDADVTTDELVHGETIITGAVELKAENYADGKYTFTVPTGLDATTENTIYLFATARNSYNHAEAGVVVRKFKVEGTNVGTHLPEFRFVAYNYEDEDTHEIYTLDTFVKALAYANGFEYDYIKEDGLTEDHKAPFGQLDMINLPNVQFNDADATGLNVEVKVYYNANATNMDDVISATMYTQPIVTVVYTTDKAIYFIEGGSFEATNAGMYTVVYSATDFGGNTTSQAYGIFVADTIAPTIIVADKAKFSDEHEVGTQFTVPEIQIRDNGVLGDPTAYDWYVEAPNGSRISYNKPEGFTPYDTGDYYIYYTATDSSDNLAISQKYHLVVSAKTELTLDFATFDYDTEVEWTEDDETLGYRTVYIPNASVVMPNLNEAVDVTITVKDSHNTSKTVTAHDAELSKFDADGEGVYTVTYTANDRFGRSVEETITVSVGDSKAPQFSWKSTSSLPASEVTVGSTWSFNINMMDVTDDNGNTIENGGITYTQVMTAPSGKTYTDGNYTFDEVGTYSFTIKFTDKSGNTDSENLSIQVKAKEANKTTHTSNAVSTVLIIASVVVLGGVVAYFVLSGRKKTPKSTSNKNTK